MNKLAFLLAAGLALPAAAQQPDDTAERQRISAERARIEAEFEQAHKACYAKFAVNDCISDARAKRREELGDLRRQELVLNDADRRRRSAERLEEIEKKTEEKRAATAAAAASAASAPARAPAKAASAPASAPRAGRPARQPKEPRQIDTGENARRHNERLEEAQQHKADVQKRAAERNKEVRPLPVPP